MSACAGNGDGKTPGVFCPLAWVHRFTNISGEIQVCCTSEETDNNIRGEDGEKMLALNSPSNETIMNSTFMKNLRRDMLAGKWPELCNRCEVTEAAGGRSRRVVESQAYAADIPAMLESTDADGNIRNLTIRSVDMRLGNICNLGCRMCNPRSSTGWHREWPSVDQDLFVESAESIKRLRDNEWYKDPAILVDIQKQLPNLRHLHFAGGEPLLVKEMQTLLQLCIDEGFAQNIELSYNTNLTVIPDALKKLWPHFNGVKLLVSVDAFGPLNDMIRHPSKWPIMDRNLRDLDTGFERYGLKEIMVMVTVQAYNVLHLKPLYDYLATEFKHVVRVPHLIDLHYPNYYSTQILPPELKALAERRLTEIHSTTLERIQSGLIPEYLKDMADILLGCIQFMKMEQRQDLLKDFLRAVNSKDKLRKQNTFALIPEFKLLEGHLNPRTSACPESNGIF